MAKHTINLVVAGDLLADLVTIFARGTADGVDFAHHGRLSKSRIIRYGIGLGAMSARTVTPSIVALPERAGTTDTERLRAAMARHGLTNVALGKLIGVSRDVVKNAVRGLAMGPALRTWLDGQEEAGR